MSRRTPEITTAPWLPLAQSLASELGLTRVRFLRGTAGTMPMAWGIVRPAVVVPIDQLTVDGQVMHNYFDKTGGPVPARGPIELQTHGSEMRFRNIYIKELSQ